MNNRIQRRHGTVCDIQPSSAVSNTKNTLSISAAFLAQNCTSRLVSGQGVGGVQGPDSVLPVSRQAV